MFIPVSVSCLNVVCRLVDTIFNIGLAKLEIMNNALHMVLSSMISAVKLQSRFKSSV